MVVMAEFSLKQTNQFILRKQHLTRETKTDNILAIAKDIGGLHSTSQTAPYLSLFSRTNNFTRTQLDEEAYEKKNLGKVRCVRKTVFLMHKEVLPWVINATKKQHAKRHVDYLANLGVTEEKYQELVNDMLKVLKGRNLSVSEIKKELNSQENISAMVNLACDKFQIIRSKPIKSWRDRRHTYSSFKEYFPDINLDKPSEEESKKQLVKYYLECFGPITENDIVWWTGFNKTETRKALAELEESTTEISISPIDKEYVMLKSDLEKLQKMNILKEPIINIIPDLDPYTMGYKERERYIDENNYNFVYDRSGNATTTILVNGQIVGIWDFVGVDEPMIKFHFLDPQKKEIYDKIKLQLKDLGNFIFDIEVPLKECKEMEPLKTRTPGEVQTPLKYCN
jgi:hypothetical protein